jgi:poly(hydroxyalkanoate) depolymerase family esterase
MIRTRTCIAALVTINAGLLVAMHAQAGSWQSNAPFGATLQGDLYTPTTPGASPAILVAIHYCTGNKSVVHSWFQSAADQNGFYIIAPDAGKQCFDSSLSRDGDKAAIVKMVNYVLSNTKADKNRVFAAGLSSGGCMTNTLLAVYPDVFAGGSAMPGFTAGGWPAGDTTCTKCCTSNCPQVNTDGKYWGDMVRSAYSFSGTRPCVQEWVGGGDEYHFNDWLPAVAAQFQNLSNLSGGTSGSGAPSGWTRTVYKDNAGNVRLETNLGPTSQKHDLSGANLFGQVVTFLGLDKPTGACGIASTSAGGSTSTGGSSSVTTGGTGTGPKATGGSSSATGGSSAKSSGGNSSVAGGTTSVATSAKATGGSPVGSGGTQGAGGGSGKATGGAPVGNGGSKATGGAASGNGGASSKATGGASAVATTAVVAETGGNTAAATTAESATGGSTINSEAGGNAAIGGETAVSNSMPGPSDQGGCGCRVAGKSHAAGTLWGFGLLGFAFAAARRRQRRS